MPIRQRLVALCRVNQSGLRKPGYKLFKLAFNIIKNKEHLTQEGINKLLVIKSYMNKGLSPELKLAFPHINIEPLKIEARPNKIPLLSFSNVATGDEAKENAY
jgi:hypothetical protein